MRMINRIDLFIFTRGSHLNLLRLLIVEDEWLNADLIGMLAEDIGCEVAGVARNIAAATALAATTNANFALVDVQLGGGIDGITFAATLRDTYGMQIAFMTGGAGVDTMNRIKAFKPFAVILKPFSAQQLQEVLERAAGERCS